MIIVNKTLFFHQPVLPVLSIHGERLPYHKAGTHYTYDKTGNLADATEIEHDNEFHIFKK